MVVPLMAPVKDAWTAGSGFLARISGELFLVTTAHIGDRELAPRAEWSLWPDSIYLADTVEVDQEDNLPKRIASFELFTEDSDARRIPLFKYHLRQDRPGRIADIILLPIPPDHPVAELYSDFDLPANIGDHEVGAAVTMLGRKVSTFPSLVVTPGFTTMQAGPLRFMIPEGEEGDSGGPVTNGRGQLLGMNVGSHENLPSQAMLMSPETIVAVASAVEGVAEDWPEFKTETT